MEATTVLSMFRYHAVYMHACEVYIYIHMRLVIYYVHAFMHDNRLSIACMHDEVYIYIYIYIHIHTYIYMYVYMCLVIYYMHACMNHLCALHTLMLHRNRC